MQTHVVAKSSSREKPRYCNFRNTLGRPHGSNANQQLDEKFLAVKQLLFTMDIWSEENRFFFDGHGIIKNYVRGWKCWDELSDVGARIGKAFLGRRV